MSDLALDVAFIGLITAYICFFRIDKLIWTETDFMEKELTAGKQKNLKLNIVFNAIYQIFVLIVPFITSPYISRVLLPEGIGSYSLALSWVTYFSTVAAFGFLDYGTTVLAKNRSDKQKSSELFWQLLAAKTIFTLLVFAVYVIMVLSGVFASGSYPLNTKLVFLLLGSNILVNAFDASYLFQGFENFGQLCLRNFVVRLLNMILIFVLVRTKNDYIRYIAIMGGSNLLLGLFSFVGIHKMVSFVKPKKLNLLHHIKESFIYFIPMASATFFPIVSKTFIGLFVKDASQSGYYEQADKLITLIITMVNSVDAIMMSRMSYLYANHDERQIQEKTKKSLLFYLLLSIPAFLGLLVINPFFTIGFFGNDYQPSIALVYILAVKVLFAPLTALLGAIYYVPKGKIWRRNIFYIIALAVNILSNFILIGIYKTTGACIASVLTEVILVVLFVSYASRDVSIFRITKESLPKIIDAALFMVIVCMGVSSLLASRISPILTAIVTIAIGGTIYVLFLVFAKEEMVTQYLGFYKEKLASVLRRIKDKSKKSKSS